MLYDLLCVSLREAVSGLFLTLASVLASVLALPSNVAWNFVVFDFFLPCDSFIIEFSDYLDHFFK